LAGETVITTIGTLVADPELRFIQSGAAVASFRIASTPRTLDRDSNTWKDGDPLFLSCSVWKQYAENVVESLKKGDQVIVQGRLKQRSYETKEGEKRTVVELDVDDVGPTLRFATAKVTKSGRGGGNSGGQGGDWGSNQGGGNVQRSGGQRPAQQAPQQEDPWATSGGGRDYSTPPF